MWNPSSSFLLRVVGLEFLCALHCVSLRISGPKDVDAASTVVHRQMLSCQGACQQHRQAHPKEYNKDTVQSIMPCASTSSELGRDEKSDAAKREELMSMQNLDRIERLEKLERRTPILHLRY